MPEWCPKCLRNGRKSMLVPFFDELHCNICGFRGKKEVKLFSVNIRFFVTATTKGQALEKVSELIPDIDVPKWENDIHSWCHMETNEEEK